MPTNYNRANLITESAALFPNNNSQLISPADLRSWLEDGTTSFVTQKDKSTLENAIFENQGSTLTTAATVDLNSATGNYVHIQGSSVDISSFGNCPAGARFILMFEDAATMTYNATSLIIPGVTAVLARSIVPELVIVPPFRPVPAVMLVTVPLPLLLNVVQSAESK